MGKKPNCGKTYFCQGNEVAVLFASGHSSFDSAVLQVQGEVTA
jgi:hypothetical protein